MVKKNNKQFVFPEIVLLILLLILCIIIDLVTPIAVNAWVNLFSDKYMKSLANTNECIQNDFIEMVNLSNLEDKKVTSINYQNNALNFVCERDNEDKTTIPKNSNSHIVAYYLKKNLKQLITIDYIALVTLILEINRRNGQERCNKKCAAIYNKLSDIKYIVLVGGILLLIAFIVTILILYIYIMNWLVGEIIVRVLKYGLMAYCLYSLLKELKINNQQPSP